MTPQPSEVDDELADSDRPEKKRKRKGDTSSPAPKIRHVLLSPQMKKAVPFRPEAPAHHEEPVVTAACVPFDYYYHITKNSVADIVLGRLGKLDTRRLWEPAVSKEETEKGSDAANDDSNNNNDVPVDNEHGSAGSTHESGPEDEAYISKEVFGPLETTNGDCESPQHATNKVLLREHVKPQSQVDIGTEVVVISGIHKGFRGILKKKLSSNCGHYLIRGTDVNVCTAHESELELARPRRRKRKDAIDRWDMGDGGKRGYVARLAFMGSLPVTDRKLSDRARDSFKEAGFIQRRNKPKRM